MTDPPKRTIHLKNRIEAQAFMKFLVMERNRYIADLKKLNDDIAKLKEKWDIPIPAIPEHHWVEV